MPGTRCKTFSKKRYRMKLVYMLIKNLSDYVACCPKPSEIIMEQILNTIQLLLDNDRAENEELATQ